MHACRTFSLAPARSLAPPMSASHPPRRRGANTISPSILSGGHYAATTASSPGNTSSQLVDVDLAHLFNADVIGSPTPEGRVSAGVGARASPTPRGISTQILTARRQHLSAPLKHRPRSRILREMVKSQHSDTTQRNGPLSRLRHPLRIGAQCFTVYSRASEVPTLSST